MIGAATGGGGGASFDPPEGARFSTGEDMAYLTGPSSAPPGAVTVTAGVHNLATLTNANPAGTTFWLSPGTHTVGTGQFAQCVPKDGNTYIGAPGAVLNGNGDNAYAFTDHATGVTIKTLEVTGFVCPFDEFVINHNAGDNWTIEGVYAHHNDGAAIGIGTGSTLRHCWLSHNRQYGFSSYKDPVDSGATPAITDVLIEYCEIDNNGDFDDEYVFNPGTGDYEPTYRGRNGSCKFWDTKNIEFRNSWVHDGRLVGVWADTNNIGFNFHDNLVEDIGGEGVFYEISYNFRIEDNTFVRCNVENGKFQARNGSNNFPRPAIYISESGGDSAVQTDYALSTIAGNVFYDCWDVVALWENSDRFCNSPANTSSKIYKPLGHGATLGKCNNPIAKTLTITTTSGSPNFTVTGGTFEDTDEGRLVSGTGIPGGCEVKQPTTANGFTKGYLSSSSGVLTANATATGSRTVTLAAGTITGADYDACRWKTQNIAVAGNTVYHDETRMLAGWAKPSGQTTGKVAMISQYGSYPAWSPYTGTAIQDVIATSQANLFSENEYHGDVKFQAKDTANIIAWSAWRSSPYSQDSGSTLTA
jgi:hypothetical protein